MTLDAQVMAWHHLFPSETTFTARSGPQPFREAVEILSTGSRDHVHVSWNEHLRDLPDLSPFDGVVAVNGRGITPDKLRQLGLSHVRRFAILPSLDTPRWYIPLGSSRITDKALQVDTPMRFIPRMQHLGVRIAVRSGLSFLFRNQVIIAQRVMPPLEQALAEALGTNTFELSISTGTPTPARKPTIAVIGHDGAILAFIKLAASPASRRLVENEAHCLRFLGSQAAFACNVPELLLAHEVDGTLIVAQRPLPGTASGKNFSDAHRDFLQKLSTGPEKFAIETTFIRNLATTMDLIGDRYPDLAKIFQLACQALEGVVVQQTVMHGDFAPWNLRLDRTSIGAFDWEYGQTDGLPLIDEMHFHWQSGLRLQKWTEEQAYHQLLTFRSSQPHTFDEEGVRALQLLSLIDVLVRKVVEGHPTTSFGPMISRLAQRLSSHLTGDSR